jgi:hypothetical protein
MPRIRKNSEIKKDADNGQIKSIDLPDRSLPDFSDQTPEIDLQPVCADDQTEESKTYGVREKLSLLGVSLARRLQPLTDLPRKRKLQIAVPVLAIFAVIMMVHAFKARNSQCSTETNLFIVASDSPIWGHPARSSKEKVKPVSDPEIVGLFAERFFSINQEFSGQGNNSAGPGKSGRSVFGSGRISDGQTIFRNPKDLAKWLSEHLSANMENSDRLSKVTVKLEGQDPTFVQDTIQSYLDFYIDYTRSSNIQTSAAEAPASEALQNRSDSDPGKAPSKQGLANLEDKLTKLTLQDRECDLVMELLDSGGGSFKGLMPENESALSQTLSKFQSKIVDLEISKNSLSMKFTPKSKEIQSVDEEIKGIKKAMRQYLVEHRRFLKGTYDMLLSEKKELESRNLKMASLRAGEAPSIKDSPSSETLASGVTLRSIGGGVVVIKDKPTVTITSKGDTFKQLRVAIATVLMEFLREDDHNLGCKEFNYAQGTHAVENASVASAQRTGTTKVTGVSSSPWVQTPAGGRTSSAQRQQSSNSTNSRPYGFQIIPNSLIQDMWTE